MTGFSRVKHPEKQHAKKRACIKIKSDTPKQKERLQKESSRGTVKGGKARPSRPIKKISGKLPEILQGAVAKCILQRPRRGD